MQTSNQFPKKRKLQARADNKLCSKAGPTNVGIEHWIILCCLPAAFLLLPIACCLLTPAYCTLLVADCILHISLICVYAIFVILFWSNSFELGCHNILWNCKSAGSEIQCFTSQICLWKPVGLNFQHFLDFDNTY